MSTTNKSIPQTLVAAADYSAASNAYKLVKLDTAAANQGLLCSVLGERADGVMTNHPALGAPIELDTVGYGKALCGAAIATAGLELTVNATGRLIAAVSTNFVFAISRNSTANAGEFVEIDMSCGRYPKP
jgi:hypothetical protein